MLLGTTYEVVCAIACYPSWKGGLGETREDFKRIREKRLWVNHELTIATDNTACKYYRGNMSSRVLENRKKCLCVLVVVNQ